MESKKLSKKEQWIVDWLKAKFDSDPVSSWSRKVILHAYWEKPIVIGSLGESVFKKLVDLGLIDKVDGNIGKGYRYKIQSNG